MDLGNGHVYWGDYSANKIERINLDGSNRTIVLQSLQGNRGHALDLTNGKIYWTERITNTVKRANLNGSNVEQIASGLNYAYGITVDSPNNHLYFSDLDGKRIFRSNLDGSNQITLFSNLGRPLNLALDVPNNHIYWADENTAKIERGNLDGTGRTDIVTGLGMPIGLAIQLGQSITFKQGETGGLRDLPLSLKPIPIARMVTSTSNLPVSLSLTVNPNSVMQLVGSGENMMLAFSQNFTGFAGAEELSVSIRATQGGNGNYNPALAVTKIIKIKKPGKKAFYDERRFDPRYENEKDRFARKLFTKKNLVGLVDLNGDGSITATDAELLFDSDDSDSDGDGVSNFLERALGGDSLFNDRLEILPKSIDLGDGKQRVSFHKYETQYNDEGIEYLVERSIDGMDWSASGVTQVDLNGGSPGKGVQMAGGMERVLFETVDTTDQAGGKQFIRVRIRSKESNSLNLQPNVYAAS